MRTALALAASLVLAFVAAAPAQQPPAVGLDPDDRGYGQQGTEGDDYGGGGGNVAGKVKLTLAAKKKQKSLKAVKVKASCENRPCTVRARGKLRGGAKRKAKLKRDEDVLAEGEKETLELKLAKKAKRTAKRALRTDRKLVAKVTAKASGVGGGGQDSAKVKVKLKR